MQTLTEAQERLALILDVRSGRRFKVGRLGVAWAYWGPVIDHVNEFDSFEDSMDHASEAYFGECGCPESPDTFIAVMVGDDTQHIVDYDDVVLIDDDDYCSGCGQIGCGHG